MGTYREIALSPKTAAFVECYWSSTGSARPGEQFAGCGHGGLTVQAKAETLDAGLRPLGRLGPALERQGLSDRHFYSQLSKSLALTWAQIEVKNCYYDRG